MLLKAAIERRVIHNHKTKDPWLDLKNSLNQDSPSDHKSCLNDRLIEMCISLIKFP